MTPDSNATHTAAWPDLHLSTWAPTKRSLHLYTQLLGKMRVALSPTQPNWMFTALYLTSRGLTTGAIPFEGSSVEATLDVFSSEITVARSNGARASIPLLPVRSVADIYEELSSALRSLGVTCFISPTPQEVPDLTPLHEDHRASAYDPNAVIRWFTAATAIAGVFDEWRACFFGRSGIQLWWGAFDIALILFSGNRVPAPTDRGYIMKYDLDAEMMNVGLYLGDETTAPFFYGYIYPEPLAAQALPIAPTEVSWSTQLHEWVLPYDAVRSAADPIGALRAFVDSIYEQCFAAAGWNREAHIYAAPKRPGSAREAMDRILASKATLGALTIRKLIDEGRRH